VRLANERDLAAIAALIPVSARALSRGFYTEEQTEAAIRHIFGPDTRLIADGTYFVAESESATQGATGNVIACGGWSKRKTLYGGDQMKSADDPLLAPRVDAAPIRAFFLPPHP